MSRYAKANQTIDDLKALIRKTALAGRDDGKLTEYCDGEEHPLWDFFRDGRQGAVWSDMSKINVDTENVDYVGEYDMPGTESLDSFEMIGAGSGAFPVAWCACGGDWELPLAFVLYIGKKGELRAYIPEDGNAYNHEEKCAYGSESNSWDEDFEPMEPGDPRYVFDTGRLRAAVAGRIMVK